jgi:hypothetical protein
MTPTELAEREARQKTYDDMLARQQAYEDRIFKEVEQSKQFATRGCVFAKSCNLPDGVINHDNPAGFVPVEKLADYGLWAVLGTGAAITAEGIPLKLVGGSATGGAIAQRLGGSLALRLLTGSAVVATGTAVGTVALLMPNTSLSPDSAFYKNEQYAALDAGRTRVRINVKTLPDGSVNAYGFYTGGKKDWEFVPVIKAKKEGEQFVACPGRRPTAADDLGLPTHRAGQQDTGEPEASARVSGCDYLVSGGCRAGADLHRAQRSV